MEELKLQELIECHQVFIQVNKEIVDQEQEEPQQLQHINLALVEMFKLLPQLINQEAVINQEEEILEHINHQAIPVNMVQVDFHHQEDMEHQE